MLRKDAYRVVRVQFLNVMLVVIITVHGVANFFFKTGDDTDRPVTGRPNNSEPNFWQDSDF